MNSIIDFQQISQAAKLLGTLFYKAEYGKETLTLAVEALIDLGLIEPQALNAFNALSQDEFDQEYLYLFEGSGHMPAPPWSSVYLDSETVLFGSSTLEYRLFLSELGLELDSNIREPEDQIGLMLLMLSYLSDLKDEKRIRLLLTEHLFTWCFHYFELVIKHANTAFYRGLAQQTSQWLLTLKHDLNIEPKQAEIYFKNE
jgi:TorA maturation chaperone TorD